MAKWPVYITNVRLSEGDAREELEHYIFGGRLGSRRPPRGIEPGFVSLFVRERLDPIDPSQAGLQVIRGSPDSYAKTGDLMRFYERADLIDHISRALDHQEKTERELRRSAAVIEAIGDLGSAEQVAAAARYFDKVLVNHPAGLDVVEDLVRALIALAPVGTIDALARRVTDDLSKEERHAEDHGPGGRRFRVLTDIQNNNIAQARLLSDRKKQWVTLSPPKLRHELAELYLGLAEVGTPQLETWAARNLRREAIENEPQPVCDEFRSAIDLAPPEDSNAEAQFVIHRAAQAVLYLRGELSAKQKQRYQKSDGGLNFLWDDP